MVVGFAFVFECQTAVGNMVQVLQPFKVGNGDTTGVDVQVGDDQNVAFDEDFIGGRSGGAVCSFGDDLGTKEHFHNDYNSLEKDL